MKQTKRSTCRQQVVSDHGAVIRSVSDEQMLDITDFYFRSCVNDDLNMCFGIILRVNLININELRMCRTDMTLRLDQGPKARKK